MYKYEYRDFKAHLCFCEFQLSRELRPLSDGQVLLLPELLLQAVQLLRRERGPRLPVRLVLPQCAAEGAGGRLESEVWKSQKVSWNKIQIQYKN